MLKKIMTKGVFSRQEVHQQLLAMFVNLANVGHPDLPYNENNISLSMATVKEWLTLCGYDHMFGRKRLKTIEPVSATPAQTLSPYSDGGPEDDEALCERAFVASVMEGVNQAFNTPQTAPQTATSPEAARAPRMPSSGIAAGDPAMARILRNGPPKPLAGEVAEKFVPIPDRPITILTNDPRKPELVHPSEVFGV
jgi:hypothetical protein